MSKKHFIRIAAIFKRHMDIAYTLGGEGVLHAVATELADEFKALNPKFDRERFLAACGF